MNVIIIGTGAMACLFGARLSAEIPVTLVGSWHAQIDTLNRHGLRLTELDGSGHTVALRASAEPASLLPADVAFVLVKSTQTQQAAQRLTACLKADGLAITLQNGLGNGDLLAEALGRERVAVGTTSQGANLTRLGELTHAGNGPTVLGAMAHPLLPLAAAWLNRAGLPTTISAEAQRQIWGKLAVNCAINPLTALFDVDNGVLAEDNELRRIMQATAEEVAAVAQMRGIGLPYPSASDQALRVARATAANVSSMRQDLRRGTPTEIEAICGTLVAAAPAEVAVPLNTQLRNWVISAESGHPIPTPSQMRAHLLTLISSTEAHS